MGVYIASALVFFCMTSCLSSLLFLMCNLFYSVHYIAYVGCFCFMCSGLGHVLNIFTYLYHPTADASVFFCLYQSPVTICLEDIEAIFVFYCTTVGSYYKYMWGSNTSNFSICFSKIFPCLIEYDLLQLYDFPSS